MNSEKKIENDENWWTSILADENPHIPELERAQENSSENTATSIWERAKRLYDDDALVSLRVVGHNRGGVLVEGEGLKGFIPYSHLIGLDDNGDSLEREAKLAAYNGKFLKLKLIECVPEKDRIVFSERAAQVGAGRRRELFSRLSRGKVVEGEVTNITDFGVFVDLGGVEGLVHISELSWGRVEHPRQIVQMREKIRVQILDLSPERCRVALSMKQLENNPWEKASEKYKIGQIVPVKVASIVSFGAFARLEEGIEGLIHNSEIPPEKRNLLKNGQEMKARILEIDIKKQRMGFSLALGENYG